MEGGLGGIITILSLAVKLKYIIFNSKKNNRLDRFRQKNEK
jgi:hypothetical protein